MGRRINDGDRTGMKLDKFRNSRFEIDDMENDFHYGGVSRSTINTLGGISAENRGRRSAEFQPRSRWDQSPFENLKLSNWKRRQGWDEYYSEGYDRGNRNRGGALIGHDLGNRGRGPKGYKRSDDSIYHDVCDTLSLSPDIDASDIEVSVKDGVVFLDGSVSSRDIKKLAEYEIENISGVTDVQNLLNFRKKEEELH